ncbi:MAG: hypothetical protein ACLPXB_03975 [Thiobacillaceae bacterium]
MALDDTLDERSSNALISGRLWKEEQFYPQVLGNLLRAILTQHALSEFKEVIVFTDNLPVQRKRSAIEKGVKTTLAAMLPTEVRYRVLHHASKSNVDLQIADYCTWAIYRKWAGQHARSFEHIRAAVKSEWDVLQSGNGFPH